MTSKSAFSIVSLLVILLIASTEMATDIYCPSLPMIANEFGTDSFWAQLTISINLFGLALASLVYGPLSDSIGRRPVILRGYALYVIGSFSCFAALNISSLLVGRLLQGLGGGVALVVGIAAVKDILNENAFAKTMSRLGMVIAISPGLAPVLGGFIAQAAGWHFVFLALGAVAVFLWVGVMFLFPETKQGQKNPIRLIEYLNDYKSFLTNSGFLAFALIQSLGFAIVMLEASQLPFLYIEQYGVEIQIFGYFFTFAVFVYVLGTVCNQIFIDKLGSDKLLTLGILGQVLSFSLICGLSLLQKENPYFVHALKVPGALGLAFIFGNCTPLALKFAGQSAGTGSALISFLQLFVASLFTYVISTAYEPSLLWLYGFLFFVSLVMLLLLRVGRKSLAALVLVSPLAYAGDYFDQTLLLPGFKERASRNIGTLFQWSLAHDAERKHQGREPVMMALLGKPTAPLDPAIRKYAVEYWQNVGQEAIGYGAPQGEYAYRQLAAMGLNLQYGVNKTIQGDDIVFTVGGSTGLHAIFYAHAIVHKDKFIVTGVPFYPTYTGFKGDTFRNRLLSFDTTQTGYRTTAEEIERRLEGVDPDQIGAFLFCDPSNPTGYVIGEEWPKIARVLRKYPKALIIVDEAYNEVVFTAKPVSVLRECPDLIDRLVILRSATKGMSAAGERFALVMTKHEAMREEIIAFNRNHFIHPSLSSQYIYAMALAEFDEGRRQTLVQHYRERTLFAYNLLRKLQIAVSPEPPEASFYNMLNLSWFMGRELEPQAQRILDKRLIETDEDIAFNLLFTIGVAIAPMSYFGVDPKLGYLRMTCSDDKETIEKIIHKIFATKESL